MSLIKSLEDIEQIKKSNQIIARLYRDVLPNISKQVYLLKK